MQTTAMNRRIYLDNAAATPLDPRVREVLQTHYESTYGNAGALHAEGVTAHDIVETARHTIARSIDARPQEVTFTSGGTEANNLAILGTVERHLNEGKRHEDLHLITTTVEHGSVLECMQHLEKRGARVSYMPVDREGFVCMDELEGALTSNTILISIILAHNEIGTIQHVHDITRIIRRHTPIDLHPVIHTDASQAPAWIPCAPQSLGVDLMTLDAQKLYGPKGIGILFHTSTATPAPILHGGAAEHPRPGTPPTALIAACAKAFELAATERASYVDTVARLRDDAIAYLQEAIPGAELNGATGVNRLPNNINLSFPGLDAEELVLRLDAAGIAASTRSACLTSAAPGSYVVRALGKASSVATSAARLSLSRYSTDTDVRFACETLRDIAQTLYTQNT